eukprot:UN22803
MKKKMNYDDVYLDTLITDQYQIIVKKCESKDFPSFKHFPLLPMLKSLRDNVKYEFKESTWSNRVLEIDTRDKIIMKIPGKLRTIPQSSRKEKLDFDGGCKKCISELVELSVRYFTNEVKKSINEEIWENETTKKHVSNQWTRRDIDMSVTYYL